MKKIIIIIVFGVCIMSGCQMSSTPDDSPEYVRLSIPGDSLYGPALYDTTFMEYKTYKWFDLQKLEGVDKADDEPFVYVRKSNQRIIVRSSNDLYNPYILTNHGLYWHCSWKGDGRGDSIKIDRFVINKVVYEYIQKKRKDGGVSKVLILTDTFRPYISDQGLIQEKELGLGITSDFDPNPEDHFLDILERANRVFATRNRNEDCKSLQNCDFNNTNFDDDSLQGYWFSTILLGVKSSKAKSPKYTEYKSGKEYHYDLAPFGLYDEYQDINRPYFLRRIK